MTDRLVQTLGYMDKYISEKGFPPSIRELGDLCNIRSTSTIHTRLKKLNEGGYIEKTKGIPRGVKITEKGRRLLSVHKKREIYNKGLM